MRITDSTAVDYWVPARKVEPIVKIVKLEDSSKYCAVCGIDLHTSMHYVCYNEDCPCFPRITS